MKRRVVKWKYSRGIIIPKAWMDVIGDDSIVEVSLVEANAREGYILVKVERCRE